MIVSHKAKFVIAAPVGLGAGQWLKRIAEEGNTGFLEIIGKPNGVTVPEGCEEYDRYIIDDPYRRPGLLWSGRAGTPWEGDPSWDQNTWADWYFFKKRREFGMAAATAAPNGWGLRGEPGEWEMFESMLILARTLAGSGNSKLGEAGPWGRRPIKVLKISERNRGWKELVNKFDRKDKGLGANSADLLDWHVPEMQTFYEVEPEIVNTMFKSAAWEIQRDLGVAD